MTKNWFYVLGLMVALFALFFFYRKYKIAPDLNLMHLQLVDMSGQKVELDKGNGKKRILCFSASWCGPCRQELRALSNLAETSLADVEIIVISDEPIEQVQLFSESTAYPFKWLKMEQPFSSVEIYSIPTSYLINTAGKIIKKEVGYVDWEDESTVRHLLKLME